MRHFNVDSFIRKYITKRDKSFFEADIQNRFNDLENEISNKNVLVIGGGGTIGSNYITSILKFRPARVVVVDTNENGLTELVRSVRSTPGLFVPNEFITYPVNLGDGIFEKIYRHYKPFDIIANFAAHKHVRSEKDIFSIEAMIENNLFNAYRLLQMIEQDQPQHFFCVSTDKAANPVNIMGATKKLMEELVMQFASSLNCTTARFANVAFSNGSLLDGFLNRMMYRQALSVPSDVKRYFVSPSESGEICMMASVLGATGDIFFPKLKEDELTSFYDITNSFLGELGYSMDRCDSETEAKEKSLLIGESGKYPVYVSASNTSGEKLYEEFYTETEVVDCSTFESLGIVKNDTANKSPKNMAVVEELKKAFKKVDINKSNIVNILSDHITTFEHIEKGMSLDLKM
jgi:FlaA1/EpsC-like NDP-sugar epimerase